MCRMSWNLGASNSWNTQGLPSPLLGLLIILNTLLLHATIVTRTRLSATLYAPCVSCYTNAQPAYMNRFVSSVFRWDVLNPNLTTSLCRTTSSQVNDCIVSHSKSISPSLHDYEFTQGLIPWHHSVRWLFVLRNMKSLPLPGNFH